MIISRNALFLIALAMVAFSLIFLFWVLQLPSGTQENYKPQGGIVKAYVLPTVDPSKQAYCSTLPEDQRDECLNQT